MGRFWNARAPKIDQLQNNFQKICFPCMHQKHAKFHDLIPKIDKVRKGGAVTRSICVRLNNCPSMTSSYNYRLIFQHTHKTLLEAKNTSPAEKKSPLTRLRRVAPAKKILGKYYFLSNVPKKNT